MAQPRDFYVNIDMHGLEIRNQRLHILSADPADPNPGDIWYNTTDEEPKITATRGATKTARPVISDDDDFANRLNTVTTLEDADMLLIWDNSVSAVDHQDQYRQISVANFTAGLNVITDSYGTVTVDSGTTSLPASGSAELILLGEGTVIETVGSVPGANKITISLKTQAQNTILAGPASGANAIPTFRSLVDADMPSSYDPTSWGATASHVGLVSGNPHQVTFLELGDTPANYTSSANYFLKVNATPNAIEFAEISWQDITTGTQPAPVQHDYDTHSGDLDLAAIAGYVQGNIIIGGAADWEALTIGANGTVLKSDGTDVSWGTVDWTELTGTQPAPVSHEHSWQDITSGTLYIPYAAGGKSNADAGTQGEIYWNDDYLFLCTATGPAGSATWKRIPMLQT